MIFVTGYWMIAVISDLVIHQTKMTVDLYILRDCTKIGHPVGLGLEVQGSAFRVNRFALFPYTIDSIGVIK